MKVSVQQRCAETSSQDHRSNRCNRALMWVVKNFSCAWRRTHLPDLGAVRTLPKASWDSDANARDVQTFWLTEQKKDLS